MPEFKEIVNSLNSRSIKEKIQAVKDLGESGDERAVEYLLNNLPELHSELRLNIVRALAKLKNKRASGPLIMVYDETPSSTLKREIIIALLALEDEKCFSKLMEIASSKDEDLYLRIFILKEIRKLGKKDSPEIINTTVQLLNDNNIEIKKNALLIVIEYEIQNIQNYLLPLIKEADIDIRSNALKHLYKMEGENVVGKIINILSSDKVDDKNKERIVEILWLIKSSKIQELLEKLVVCNIEKIRRNAVISLSHFNYPEVTEVIAKRLNDESAEVKKAALMALAQMNGREYMKKILPLLMDKDEKVRKEAALTIENLISEKELSKLEPLLRNPNDKIVEGVLNIFASKKYFPDNFYSLVDDFIKIDNETIQKKIVDILSVIKDRKSYDFLISIYNKVEENIKVEILYKIKNYDSLFKEIVPVIFDYYKKEESPKLRSIITDIIAQGKDKESGELLMYIVKKETDSRTRSNAIEALENYENILDEVELVNTIMPALKDKNNRVKANAAKALWKFGGLRMVAMLNDMLKSEGRWERASACFVLGEIASVQVVPILESALKDPEDVVRANAVKALGKCGEDKVIEDIIQNYNKETEVVKQALIFSLRFIRNEKYMDFILEKLEDKNENIATEAAFTFNLILKKEPAWLEKISDSIEKINSDVIKVLINGIGQIHNHKALELLERLSYHSDIEVASGALTNYKKVENIVFKGF
ncbi:MAG: HEAT repeat domain-containing protein [Candidatus Muiribacteriota bacterium]